MKVDLQINSIYYYILRSQIYPRSSVVKVAILEPFCGNILLYWFAVKLINYLLIVSDILKYFIFVDNCDIIIYNVLCTYKSVNLRSINIYFTMQPRFVR